MKKQKKTCMYVRPSRDVVLAGFKGKRQRTREARCGASDSRIDSMGVRSRRLEADRPRASQLGQKPRPAACRHRGGQGQLRAADRKASAGCSRGKAKTPGMHACVAADGFAAQGRGYVGFGAARRVGQVGHG